MDLVMSFGALFYWT